MGLRSSPHHSSYTHFPRSRPLRMDDTEKLHTSGDPAPPPCCRLCWEPQSLDEHGGGQLIDSPCHCTGSMRYIHPHCLGRWQYTLRRQKGFLAARRCDICSAPWTVHCPSSHPNDNEDGYKFGNGVGGRLHFLRGAIMAAQPLLILSLELWKGVVVAKGIAGALNAAGEGARTGMHLHYLATTNSTTNSNDTTTNGNFFPFFMCVASIAPLLQLPLWLAVWPIAGARAPHLQALMGALAWGRIGLFAGFAAGALGAVATSMVLLRTTAGNAVMGVRGVVMQGMVGGCLVWQGMARGVFGVWRKLRRLLWLVGGR